MRLFFVLVLLALATTVISLPLLALTTLTAPWPLLFVVVGLGWLSQHATRRLSLGRQRGLLAVSAMASALLVPLFAAGNVAALFQRLQPGQPGFAGAYTLLLVGLVLFWRGMQIDHRDGNAAGVLFGRGAALAVASLLLGTLMGTGRPLNAPEMLLHIVGFGATGLLALALTHAQATNDGERSLNWRWLATMLGSVAMVLGLAILGVGLIGGDELLGTVEFGLRIVVLPFALIGGILVWLVLTIFGEPLRWLLERVLEALDGFDLRPIPPPEGGQPGVEVLAPVPSIGALVEGASLLLAVIPLILLLIAIMLWRRRTSTSTQMNEERESLGVLQSLGEDVRSLLSRLRHPFSAHRTGLRAALADLKGNDATTRTRRAYVRMLLRLEAKGLVRHDAQTPTEFAHTTAPHSPSEPALTTLTQIYEQARYHPDGVGYDEAERAEAILRIIEHERKPEPS
ncbi:DUF4129 domain-containing protein [Candidatus Chloroploca asiatica]|uniref:Protein-glutamine gamma-glutamyltransferase-like C-terminal domain-containing protein n=1 Tax=Candidatus Chloroploca asiatica TaxID=1506545 RepID=A0A2H3KKC7_9CHLR|nr:DUF4129 domain-containing protein [Candidatus Chloroploca asiatica]PDV97643.1 hypothetical protein A9Q02_04095 [Candidatus Chloroploca asiatica]